MKNVLMQIFNVSMELPLKTLLSKFRVLFLFENKWKTIVLKITEMDKFDRWTKKEK